jgi:predicted acyltransferase
VRPVGAAPVTTRPVVPSSPGAQPIQEPPPRLTSLDAYRGFVMLLMVSAGFGIPIVAKHFEDSAVWRTLGYQLDHVTWAGCSVWDLIQPSFMFIVGAAIPFSYASRRARGHSSERIWLHALLRSIVLIFLGIFLMSDSTRQTNWIFTNVLTQIGFGYMVVFALRGTGLLIQLLVATVLLVGYGLVFVYHFDDETQRIAVRPVATNEVAFLRANASRAERFDGDEYASHWNKNMNFASDVDESLLSQLRRTEPMRFNLVGRQWESHLFYRTDAQGRPEFYRSDPDGYTTLNFIPSIATMIFGLMAGELLRRKIGAGLKFTCLALAGLIGLVVALALDHYIWPAWLADVMAKVGDAMGIGGQPFFAGYSDGGDQWPWTLCPIVKRIWTPTWAVYCAGWSFLALAGFYGVIDVLGWKWWAFPFVVVGMNSIAIYCMAMLLRPWLVETIHRHFGPNVFTYGAYEPIIKNAVVVLLLWLVCLWLYRRRIFLRI